MKNKKISLIFFVIIFCAVQVTRGLTSYIKAYFNQDQTFDEWAQKCSTLPFLKDNPINPYQTPLNEDDFTNTLYSFIAQQSVLLRKPAHWVCDAPQRNCPIFKRPTTACKPFAQRLLVSTGSKIAFHGDLHGDIHSLIIYLQKLHAQGMLSNFKIKDPHFYMIFLGDYVDRGLYGCEVIYTLLRLKLANPQKVFLVRGNHEDIGINAGYSFSREIQKKYSNNKELFATLDTIYSLLPVVLYLGCNNNFLQCCHGGMEVGFNSHELLDAPEQPICFHWLSLLQQKTNALKTNCACFQPVLSYLKDKAPENCFDIGFMWNDFKVDITKNAVYNPSRGLVYNKDATLATLKLQSSDTNKVCGVIRAHQHTPYINAMMQSLLRIDSRGNPLLGEQHRRGLSTLWSTHATTSKLWQGIVCTLLVSPDTGYSTPYKPYPGFDYDTYATLTTADYFEEWDLQVCQNKVF